MSSMKNKIIFYDSNGKIENIMELNSTNLEKINGMMTRCTMIDGTKITGLADPFKTCENNSINTTVQDYIYLNTWDSLDETTHQLIDTDMGKYSQTHTMVYIKEIISVESILHSNPRWGGLLTNRFEVVEEEVNDWYSCESDS